MLNFKVFSLPFSSSFFFFLLKSQPLRNDGATKMKIAAKWRNKGERRGLSRKQFIYLMFPAFYCRPKQIYDEAQKQKVQIGSAEVFSVYSLSEKGEALSGTRDKGEHLTKAFRLRILPQCRGVGLGIGIGIWKSFAGTGEVYISCPLNLHSAFA